MIAQLDGQDFNTTYGFVISSGKSDFLKLPTLKEPLSFDWKDKTGIERDLSNPVFEPRFATLKGHMLGNDRDDFFAKQTALFEALKQPGERKILIPDLQQEFRCFYRSNNVTDIVTKVFQYSSKIAIYMELTFEIISGGYVDAGAGTFYFGPVATFPTTWTQILALTAQSEANGNIINLNTGTVQKNYAVVLRKVKNITKALDLNASNSNLTTNYKTVRTASILNPQGVEYKVLGLSQLLPYSVDHIHNITTA